MRVALLSDIHGNSIALEAVLNDIALQGGADAYWILGDLVALGPDPVHVLEQLSALPMRNLFAETPTDMSRLAIGRDQHRKR